VRTDGAVVCWGWDLLTNAPSGAFTSVSAGYHHSCAVRVDGSVACWPAEYVDIFPGTAAPKGVFTSVSATVDYTCGLRPGGKAECWGDFGWD
jgi:hypothetical protein